MNEYKFVLKYSLSPTISDGFVHDVAVHLTNRGINFILSLFDIKKMCKMVFGKDYSNILQIDRAKLHKIKFKNREDAILFILYFQNTPYSIIGEE